MAEPLRDKTGREIMVGDIVKVFHFVGARNKRHFMYKQAIGMRFFSEPAITYMTFSHLNMKADDTYVERMDGRLLRDYEIVQSVDAQFDRRDRRP